MTLQSPALRLLDDPAETGVDFAALARMRRGMSELVEFVQFAAGARGCSLSMYHLLLAVKMIRSRRPDIGMLASSLGVRHPSAAEMVRKAEAAGFVESFVDVEDRRRVLIGLTEAGNHALREIADEHLVELRRIRAGMIAALNALG